MLKSNRSSFLFWFWIVSFPIYDDIFHAPYAIVENHKQKGKVFFSTAYALFHAP